MRLVIAAVGRLKDGPDRALLDRYMKRLTVSGRGQSLIANAILEIPESRAETAGLRQVDEAQRLAKLVTGVDYTVVLDETGTSMTSRAFAHLLAGHRDRGIQSMAFVIGGPDGHDNGFRKTAQFKLSLGPMTLPHGLARIVLAEQLYRATTIMAGHPYHRD
jgi:23S rRNA (pseudouridine1915-N3)-methyltransferase